MEKRGALVSSGSSRTPTLPVPSLPLSPPARRKANGFSKHGSGLCLLSNLKSSSTARPVRPLADSRVDRSSPMHDCAWMRGLRRGGAACAVGNGSRGRGGRRGKRGLRRVAARLARSATARGLRDCGAESQKFKTTAARSNGNDSAIIRQPRGSRESALFAGGAGGWGGHVASSLTSRLSSGRVGGYGWHVAASQLAVARLGCRMSARLGSGDRGKGSEWRRGAAQILFKI
jgi:hypothetical protein